MSAEQRLAQLGLVLPPPVKVPPNVSINFVWARRHGDRVLLSGHGPQAPDGSIAPPFGQVGGAVTPEQAYEAARLADARSSCHPSPQHWQLWTTSPPGFRRRATWRWPPDSPQRPMCSTGAPTCWSRFSDATSAPMPGPAIGVAGPAAELPRRHRRRGGADAGHALKGRIRRFSTTKEAKPHPLGLPAVRML